MTILETARTLTEGQRIMVHVHSSIRSTFIGKFVSLTFIRGCTYELIIDEETEAKTLAGKKVYEKRFLNNSVIKKIEKI